MSQFFTMSFGFVVMAALVDIMANMALTRSKGFKYKGWGIAAIVLVLTAFTLLAQAVKEIDLAIAYASWVRLVSWVPQWVEPCCLSRNSSQSAGLVSLW